MNSTKTWLILGAIILIALLGWWGYAAGQPGKYDTFATCLKEKGAIFYGAYWCPHCQNQKKEFGVSAKLLPYVECSTPDGKEQTQVCKDAGIKGYPTWKFADGSEETGEVSLADLATKTSCPLPE